jgi:hypothetical protein
MFISYKAKYLGIKDDKDTWGYELMDSEFGMVSGTVVDTSMVEAVIAVIQEYSKRNLNVAANLAIALVWYSKQNPYWSIQEMIYYNKEYNPLFPPYEEDLQKYLVLL